MTGIETSSISIKSSFHKTLFAIAFALIHSIASCQPEQEGQRYFQIGKDETSERVIPASGNGLYLVAYFSGPRNDHIEITHLDTMLATKWTGEVKLNGAGEIIGGQYFNGNIFLLLNHAGSRKKGMEIVRIDEDKTNATHFPVYNFIPLQVTEFRITPKAALLCGYYSDVPVVIYFDLTTLKSRVLPGLFNLPGDLNQLRVYEDGSFDLVIASKNLKHQHALWLKSFDSGGNLLRNVALDPPEKTSLIFGQAIREPDGKQVISGVFGNRSGTYSRGLFIATVTPDGKYNTQYYGFGELEHFFDFLKPKRENRIKHRIARRKAKNRISRFSYKVLVDNFISMDERTFLLGEVFYPRYRAVDFYNGSYFPHALGSDYFRNTIVFDGYEYTHAILLYFDQQGNRISDQTIKIDHIKTYDLGQVVNMDLQNHKLVLFYVESDKLNSTVIHDDQTAVSAVNHLVGLPGELAPPEHHGERQTDLKPWYHHTYYATGRTLSPDNAFQRVFFISKITCR